MIRTLEKHASTLLQMLGLLITRERSLLKGHLRKGNLAVETAWNGSREAGWQVAAVATGL